VVSTPLSYLAMRFKSQPQMLLLLSLPHLQHCNLLIAQLLVPLWTHLVLPFHQNCVTTRANLCFISAGIFKQVLGSWGLLLQQKHDASLLQGIYFSSMGHSMQMRICRWPVSSLTTEGERKWELSLFANCTCEEACEEVRVGVHCNPMAIPV